MFGNWLVQSTVRILISEDDTKIDLTWLNKIPEGKAHNNANTTITPLELQWGVHNITG
jgi:hypothetical protein